MLYDIDRKQLDPLRADPPNGSLSDAEVLWAWFETDPEVIRRCLPQGLEPGPQPRAVAFVASYPETNFGISYNEGGLLLACRHRGEQGIYALSMPVDDDTAMIGGRERQGFPKKMAESITLEREGSRVVGSVTRRGSEILRIEAERSGPAPSTALDLIGPPKPEDGGQNTRVAVNFNYKFFPSADNRAFDFVPRLIRLPVTYRPRREAETGRASVHLGTTPFDPLGELPVREVVDVLYGHFDIEILPGKTVGHAWNLLRFLPHAFFKSDIVAWLLAQRG
jgi:acetoacetate decarboxylase